jgi:hypothetical protein
MNKVIEIETDRMVTSILDKPPKTDKMGFFNYEKGDGDDDFIEISNC